MGACFLPFLFLMFGFLYFEGMRSGNIQFGVTLWQGIEQEQTYQKIKRRFGKEMRWILFICLILFGVTCIPNRTSIVITTQMLWFLLVLVIFFFPVAWANKRLKFLKRERMMREEVDQEKEIEADKKTEVAYVDIQAAAQPKKVPFLWVSLVGALIGIVSIIGEFLLAGDSFYGWTTQGILITMVCVGFFMLWMQYYFCHMSTDIVSYKSEVNIQLNRVNRYQWSRFWSIMIWCNAIFSLVTWYGMHRPDNTFTIIMTATIIYMLVAFVTVFLTYRNVKKVFHNYPMEAPVKDDDEHWIWGMFYYNKKDNRFMVNKRTGIGTTVNMAKTSAKVFMAIIVISIFGLTLGACGFMLAQDFTPVSLEVTEHTLISGQYKNDYTVLLSGITEIELLEELPDMNKRVGTEMETLRKGSFLDDKHQPCQVCVRCQKPPYIKIADKNGGLYYLNDENPEETRKIYEILQERFGL